MNLLSFLEVVQRRFIFNQPDDGRARSVEMSLECLTATKNNSHARINPMKQLYFFYKAAIIHVLMYALETVIDTIDKTASKTFEMDTETPMKRP